MTTGNAEIWERNARDVLALQGFQERGEGDFVSGPGTVATILRDEPVDPRAGSVPF